MSPSLSLLLTGDALITRPYVVDSPGRQRFVDLVRSVDVAMTNVESPFNAFVGPPAHGIGIHLSTTADRAADLQRIGFNLFAAANNHALDYGIEGLRRHIEVMRHLGMPFAGVGDDATTATRAAAVATSAGRVALVACASSLGAGWPAADATSGVQARPGINALGFTTTYEVDPARLASLHDVADVLGLAAHSRYELEMGYVLAPSTNDRSVRLFGQLVTEAAAPRVASVPNPVDVARITEAVAAARRVADVVIVYLHTQEHEAAVDVPAGFVGVFARACIDAGADVVTASGPHVMRGVEMYEGRPILHGLGNLWFQYDQLERLPSDSLTSYGLPATASVDDFARTAMLGFRRDPRYWRSAVASLTLNDGRLSELTLHPVSSGYGRDGERRGAPEAASTEDALAVLNEVAHLSARLGTDLQIEDGLARLQR
jgi:poly-gamma-glutamate synthesis protein (capsule biosynthesis protein)